MEIGDRIKQKRQELGLSQQELATKMGYKSRSSVNKIEVDGRGLPQSKIKAFAEALNTTPSYLMGWLDEEREAKTKTKGVRIPVLGKVVAGIPIETIENYDADEWEEIPKEQADKGNFFALKITGASMEPKFSEGDVVIVEQKPDIESGQIAVVLINGSEATVKKVTKSKSGIMLTATNEVVYPPTFYTNEEIEALPVTILGKVVELRAKF